MGRAIRERRDVSPEEVLRLQGMPQGEIATVLAADDPELVRRHLALHRERLHEQLEEQLRTLDRLVTPWLLG